MHLPESYLWLNKLQKTQNLAHVLENGSISNLKLEFFQ